MDSTHWHCLDDTHHFPKLCLDWFLWAFSLFKHRSLSNSFLPLIFSVSSLYPRFFILPSVFGVHWKFWLWSVLISFYIVSHPNSLIIFTTICICILGTTKSESLSLTEFLTFGCRFPPPHHPPTPPPSRSRLRSCYPSQYGYPLGKSNSVCLLMSSPSPLSCMFPRTRIAIQLMAPLIVPVKKLKSGQ